MSNEEQMADTIEMLYQRLNSYNRQDLFNYGYLLESNQILCKDIEEKDKQLDKYKNVIDKIKEYIHHEYFKREQLGIVDKTFYASDMKCILELLEEVE